MHISGRQLLVSGAVVVGLLIPQVSAAAASPSGVGVSTGKQALMLRLSARAGSQSVPLTTSSQVPLSRLATEVGKVRAVGVIKLRPGSSGTNSAVAILHLTGHSLGANLVGLRAALVAPQPDSVPALTLPVGGATVAGAVQLSATSSAPKVSFLIDGYAIGTPVDTTGGVAKATWTSWGVANGPHTVAAADCNISNQCNTQLSQVGVTLDNLAPYVTSPRASQILSGAATFTATAPGGGVAFIIDGIRRGFDASAPYTLTYTISSLVDGAHTVKVISCSTNASACSGPASATVSFTAKSLHPRVTTVSPSVFSPNGDGRFDTTKVTYYLPVREYVYFQVRNGANAIVRGPIYGGTLSAGTHSFTWNGILNNRTKAGNGVYKIELNTGSGTLRGYSYAHVWVDITPPTITSIAGSGATFYPYPDGYKDTWAPRFVLSERSVVTMKLTTGRGALVRAIVGARNAGLTSLLWNGRSTAGALVPAGVYYWTLTAQDSVGNRHASARYSVVVSAHHLVTRTATLSLRGSQYVYAGGTDSSCTEASNQLSDFSPYGVWLLNACPIYTLYTNGYQIAGAIYRFTVPAAFSYTSLRLDSYGNSLFAPSTLGVGFTRWVTDDYTFRDITVGSTNTWRTVGSVAAAGMVSSGSRQVETTLYVPNDYNTSSDFDIGYVRLVITYRVFV